MHKNQPSEIGALLLDIGAMLMSSGANTNRIRLTIQRIGKSYNYKTDFLITHRAIILTLKDSSGNVSFNELKQTYAHIPNFKIVSGLSKLSWRIVEEKFSVKKARKEVKRLKALPHYPRFLVLSVVAFACSSFCRLNGGSFIEMAIVFIAAFLGLFLKQELAKKKVNPFFNIFIASFFSAMLAGAMGQLLPYGHDRIIFITSILYLIPGIQLINSITDILDGNTLNGIVRAFIGLVVSFSISTGLLLAILIFNTN
ncbi:threonine/serine exporter ThrE family protein [Mariniflexile gromovii]|uniref:Threonine/serine exporter family protein n=1 Tax=Mariniflexile gromovii TaxID=362523 RepID=A0ABS4BYJ2_9FLAO|nr:threonine/serine exporter family protein [Mariniflexile gromovii]MBP0905654.1 threonine/serine exporter family protein [Mariniflexile gromovii]